MNKRYFIKSTACVLASLSLVANSIPSVAFAQGDRAWRQQDGLWKYYDASNKFATSWLKLADVWYYFDTVSGVMKTGWHLDTDGKWYFLSTASGAEEGKMLTAWQTIGGYDYYFNPDGSLAVSTTVDNKRVNSEGRVIDALGNAKKSDKEGYPSIKNTQSVTKPDKKIAGGGRSSSSSSSASSSGGSYYSSSSGGSSSGSSSSNTGSVTNASENSGDKTGASQSTGESTNQGAGKIANTDAGSTQNNPDTQEILISNQTKLITSEIGWARYVSVAFKSGSLADYTVEVDGRDITASLTPVDDEKTIVKWLSTVSSPKKLKAKRISDGAVQEVILNSTREGESVVVPGAGNPADAPDYFISNARIAKFDYYIDSYDSEGNAISELQHTTFDLSNSRAEKSINVAPKRYYAPDAKVDALGRGKLVVKLALDSEDNKNWFNNITKIKLLTPEYSILNNNVLYATEVEDTAHGSNGIIEISLPQDNFRNRGRYYLNIASSYASESRTIPIHLVDAAKFELLLNGSTANPRTGESIRFTVKGEHGESFGNDIRIVAKRAVLTKPSGRKLELENPKDWYVIGDLFVISGRRTEAEGSAIITDEAGVYTVELFADGYQSISKRFEIVQGDTPVIEAGRVRTRRAVDAVSSASAGSGISDADISSGAGIGGYTNGNYQFSHDLLVNALILNELGRNNEASRAVIRRWFDDVLTTDYVFDGDTDELYDYTLYLNKVRDIRLDEGRELSFEQFKRTYPSAKSTQVPGDVKLVLEDGRLGTTERFANQLGTVVPVLSGTEVFRGEAFTLTSSDDNYFSKITELVMDGSSQALRSDAYLRQYKLSDDKKSLTIYPSAFNGYYPPLVGEHKLKIVAAGYEVREFVLKIKEKELDISLTLPERDFKINEDLSINLAGSAADIEEFKSLISSIHIVRPDNSNRNVYTASVGGDAGNDYYEFTEDSLLLKGGLFKTEGEYQLHIKYSTQPNKVFRFTVKKEDPVPTLEAVPTVKEFKFDKIGRSPFSRYYELVFDTSVMSVEDVYKFTDNASAKVEVNGKAYAKKGSERELNSSRNSYVVWDDATMYLTEDAFNKEENLIKISVDGYETFEYIIKKEVDITPNIVIRSDMNALRVGLVKKNEYDAYYLSKFKNTNMKVSINGVEFSKYNRSGRLPAATYSLYSDGATGNVLGIYVSNVNLDLSQPVDISIKLDGYEELTINYTE